MAQEESTASYLSLISSGGKPPPKESPKAARAFEEYYALGEERSLRALANKTGTALGQLGGWSSAFKWQARVIERDRKEMERKRRRRQVEQEKMNEDHAAWGKAMAALAMKQCQDLIKAKSFNAQAAVLLFKYSTDLQRLAMGDSTETIRMQLADTEGEIVEGTAQVVPSIMVYLPKKDEGDHFSGQEGTPRV